MPSTFRTHFYHHLFIVYFALFLYFCPSFRVSSLYSYSLCRPLLGRTFITIFRFHLSCTLPSFIISARHFGSPTYVLSVLYNIFRVLSQLYLCDVTFMGTFCVNRFVYIEPASATHQPSGEVRRQKSRGGRAAELSDKRQCARALCALREYLSADTQTDVAPGVTRSRNMRSRCRCSMCPAIHINSRSWLRSSSTHEPSDPPHRVVCLCLFEGSSLCHASSISALYVC